MSKQNQATQQQPTAAEAREAVLAIWPQADLKGVRKEDLLWLLDVARFLRKAKEQMSEILRRYRVKYETCTTAGGRKSKRCGDELSVFLTGYDHMQVLYLAETVLDLEGQLWEKYQGLNNGQIRMNASNRLRGALKREDVTLDEIKAIAEANKKGLAHAAAA